MQRGPDREEAQLGPRAEGIPRLRALRGAVVSFSQGVFIGIAVGVLATLGVLFLWGGDA